MSSYLLIAKEPDDIEYTLTVTMTLGEWKKLDKQLAGESWPAIDFHSHISDMIIRARKYWYPES